MNDLQTLRAKFWQESYLTSYSICHCHIEATGGANEALGQFDEVFGEDVQESPSVAIAKGWQPHSGGPQPVPDGTKVTVFPRGSNCTAYTAYSEGVLWEHCGSDTDILAYEVACNRRLGGCRIIRPLNGWGGASKPPVSDGSVVTIFRRSDDPWSGYTCVRAGDVPWEHTGGGEDIISYSELTGCRVTW